VYVRVMNTLRLSIRDPGNAALLLGKLAMD
jgi:hypothetical protein